MNSFLFVIIHIMIGIALVFYYGRLPKTVSTFAYVFLIMSFVYFGRVLLLN